MASLALICRLCLKHSTSYSSIHTFSSISSKYFQDEILYAEFGHHVICCECWDHISTFHKFKQSVINAHARMVKTKICPKKFKLLIFPKKSLPPASDPISRYITSDTAWFDIFVLDESYKDTVELEGESSEIVMDSRKVTSPHNDLLENESALSLIDQRNVQAHASCVNTDDDLIENEREVIITEENVSKHLALESANSDNQYALQNSFDAYYNKANEHDNIEYLSLSSIDGEFSSNEEDANSNEQNFPRFTKSKKRCGQEISKNVESDLSKTDNIDNEISKFMPNLKCRDCNDTCNSFSALKLHYKVKHPDQRCSVFCCKYSFSNRSQLLDHVRFHLNPQILTCEQCGKVCRNKYYLKAHKCLKTKDSSKTMGRSRIKRGPALLDYEISQYMPNLQCIYCDDTYRNFKELQNHCNENHPEDPCLVACCDKKFKGRSDLAEHVRFHLNPQEFIKRNYSKTKQTKVLPMKFHESTEHAGGLEKLLSDKIAAELDIILSTINMSLKCGVCLRPSSTYKQLLAHFELWHSDQDTHVSCCGRKFFDPVNIEKHFLMHKQSDGSYICQICYMPFKEEVYLICHMSEHKSTPIQNDNPKDETVTLNLQASTDKELVIGEELEVSKSETKKLKRSRSADIDNIIAKWKPLLPCSFCEQTCPNFVLLKEHYEKCHPGKRCIVQCCNFNFSRRWELGEHLQFHTNPKSENTCKICGKWLRNRFSIDNHMRSVHIGKHNRLPKKDTLKVDVLLTEMKVDLECGVCARPCSSYTRLLSHFRLRHMEQICHIKCCGQMFYHHNDIEQHISKHKNMKADFVCEICKMSFELEEYVKSHIGMHNAEAIGEDDMSEDECLTKRKHALTLDEKIAQWRPTLKCEICSEKCHTFTELRRHFGTTHPDVQCYVKCCNHQFRTRFTLMKHATEHQKVSSFHKNNDDLQCKICHKVYGKRCSLRIHMSNVHKKYYSYRTKRF
ncbi:uncharacterized protein LOC142231810 [Haematobia irritans]|uniref:uncharacterized protein LOC142231810 n=1 Tax=Haematobia irritans TaxID=7368 RepID=UPI003F4FCA75